MKEKETWEDVEFKELAAKLLELYPQFFPEDFTLDCFYFIRTAGIRPKWAARIRRCGHPWGSLPGLEEITYLVETADNKWKVMSEAQRALLVFHELKHVPLGGCDDDDENCGKLLDHPVQDFPEVIAAADGNLFWNAPGQEIPNMLNNTTPFDFSRALRKTGFTGKIDRTPLERPDETSEDVVDTVVTQLARLSKQEKPEEATIDVDEV